MKNKWASDKEITRTINGREIRFRKVPVGTLQKCRALNDNASKFLGMLFKDKTNDIEVEQIESRDGNKSFKQSAADPSIIQLRKTQTEEGIKGLLNTFTDDATLLLLSEIIVKSAYDEFTQEDIPNLKDELGLDDMIELLKGAFEASAGDYADLGKSLLRKNQMVSDALDQIRS